LIKSLVVCGAMMDEKIQSEIKKGEESTKSSVDLLKIDFFAIVLID
jgi:hypothetical protein